MTHPGGRPPAPQRIVLARHGATEWSRGGRHTGRTDLPLVSQGETEAISLGKKLSGLLADSEPGAVLSSPLSRALDTARLAGYGDGLEVEDDLAEWDYGRYEGRTTSEIRMERPGWDLFRDGCPGGEQASDVAKRVETVLSRLAGRADLAGRTVVVFAHGHLLRVLGSVYAGFGAEGGRALAFDTGRLGVLGWLHEARALEGWNI